MSDCVGATGFVYAVEPQARLWDLMEVNMALNAQENVEIIRTACGATDGDAMKMHLFPLSNTGASSLVRKSRFTRKQQLTVVRTLDSLMKDRCLEHVRLVKVDVEGFEDQVVNGMKDSLAANAIRYLLLDYHPGILQRRGVDPLSIHTMLLHSGMKSRSGEPANGYVIYESL